MLWKQTPCHHCRQQRMPGGRRQHHRRRDADGLARRFSLCPVAKDSGHPGRHQQHPLPQDPRQGLLLPVRAVAQAGQGELGCRGTETTRRPLSRLDVGPTLDVWLSDQGQPGDQLGQPVVSPSAGLHPSYPNAGLVALQGTCDSVGKMASQ